MSKADLTNIATLGRPLTEAERAYLHDRSRDWEIAQNDRMFGGNTHINELPLYSDVADEVASPEPESIPVSSQEQVVAAVHDLSKYDETLVKEVKTLNLGDLRAELKNRGVAHPAGATKEHLQLLLVQEASKQEQ